VVNILKEIGETLKDARENIGLSIEEAASDLKLRPSQIENIEAGNKDAFKDVFYMKHIISDYARYLGLDSEDMIDEFNEYMFECTSRISLDDIKKAKKKIEKKEKKEQKVLSPYTLERKNNDNLLKWFMVIIVMLLIGLITFLVVTINSDKKDEPNNGIVASANIVK